MSDCLKTVICPICNHLQSDSESCIAYDVVSDYGGTIHRCLECKYIFGRYFCKDEE